MGKKTFTLPEELTSNMIQLFASAAIMLTDEPPAGVFTEKPVNTLPAAAGRDTDES